MKNILHLMNCRVVQYDWLCLEAIGGRTVQGLLKEDWLVQCVLYVWCGLLSANRTHSFIVFMIQLTTS